jgi:hypothetical protein
MKNVILILCVVFVLVLDVTRESPTILTNLYRDYNSIFENNEQRKLQLQYHHYNKILELEAMRKQQTQTQEQQQQSHTTIYHLQSTEFVNEVLDCLQDADCTIQFLHYGKTGGSDIEKKFYQLTDKDDSTVRAHIPGRYCSNKSFHEGECVVDYFRKHIKNYCNSKFFSLETNTHMFLNQVVPTCMQYRQQQYQSHNITTTKPRSILLSSYREPIERLISRIHQLCNKNLHTRDKETQQMCTRCSYSNDDIIYWNKYANASNNLYDGMLHFARSSLSSSSSSFASSAERENIKVLMIDTKDITSLYNQMNTMAKERMMKNMILDGNSGHQQVVVEPLVKGIGRTANKERVQICDFGIHSALIRQISYSSEVYRNLTMGGI